MNPPGDIKMTTDGKPFARLSDQSERGWRHMTVAEYDAGYAALRSVLEARGLVAYVRVLDMKLGRSELMS